MGTHLTVFKLAELFSGPGGLALGATKASATNKASIYKVKSVWANDIDSYTCKTYSKNIHSSKPGEVVCAPIQDVDISNWAFGFFSWNFLRSVLVSFICS